MTLPKQTKEYEIISGLSQNCRQVRAGIGLLGNVYLEIVGKIIDVLRGENNITGF